MVEKLGYMLASISHVGKFAVCKVIDEHGVVYVLRRSIYVGVGSL